MATHSSILAWRIPCTEKCHELQFKGFIKNQIQFSDCAHTHTTYYYINWVLAICQELFWELNMSCFN